MVTEPDKPVPGPWTQAEQLAFVERALAEFPRPRWTIVLVHQPLWDYPGGARGDWPRVEEMLGERDYTVFAGHFHRYVKAVRRDRKYVTLATTGGGSSLRGGVYGEFDHVAWVTMTASGPRIANLMLSGIQDENVVTSASRRAVRALAGQGLAAEPVVRSLAPSAAPTVDAQTLFEKGAVAFLARNQSAAEVVVRYHVDGGVDMRYQGAHGSLTLPPGAAERIELPLIADPPVAYGRLAPGRVEWTLETVADGERAHVELASALLPPARLRIPTGAATVDGDLREWGALPFNVTRQGDVASPRTAATDIRFSFGLRESGGELYLAARVSDDILVASEALGPDVQDALVLFADARPDPERSANLPLYPAGRLGHLERMAIARMTLADVEPEDKRLAASIAAVDWRASRTADGYVVEAAISGAFLNEQAGGDWRAVRIGLVAVDWDEGESGNRIAWHVRGSSATALHWRPDRFGAAPLAGTGTFVRDGAP